MRILLVCKMTLLACSIQAQTFIDATANLPSTAAGANMDLRSFDMDNDGDQDLVFAREGQANYLLKNNGLAVFTNGTVGNLPQEIHDSEDVAIADFNNDSHLDLVFCSEDDFTQGFVNVHEYYLGNGTGKFIAAAYQFPDSEANAVITADINSDGFPDLLFGNKGTIGVQINNGTGNFTTENQRITQIIRTTQDLATGDLNNDGYVDVVAGNENGNLIFINDSTGVFNDETAARFPPLANMETRKITLGDVDSDGDLDIFFANVFFIPGKDAQNRLFINDGTGHFTDETTARLPVDNDHSIDAIFEDIDLDNDLDLVIANVFGAHVKVYLNNSLGQFADSTLAILGQFYVRDALGVIANDFNGDGLRDLYICNRRMPGSSLKDLLLLRAPISSVSAPIAHSPYTIYPNPVLDHLFIQTDKASIDTIRLYSNDGKLIGSLAATVVKDGVFRCNLPPNLMGSGVYWIEIDGVKSAIFIQ